jgi:hypothetical protein
MKTKFDENTRRLLKNSKSEKSLEKVIPLVKRPLQMNMNHLKL